MKKLVYCSVIFFLITACSIKKTPTFLKVDNVKLLSFKSDTIRLKADAYFKNENDIGGKLSTDEIKVFVNEEFVANVSSEEFKVPANKEFAVPLLVAIPSKEIFKKNKGGLLGSLLNTILSKNISVRFKGDINYKVLGFSKIYAVDKVKELKLN